MKNNTLKLYRVTLRGMTYSCTGVAYGSSYVIAENSDEAYKKVRKFLDENDLGFTKDRELDKVELIADSGKYTDVECLLYL
jgi:Iap family predicted aminopeptidase